MSAKSEAIKKLGREDDYINLKGLNTERTNAQNRYNTDYTNLQNKYNELVAQADRNKLAAKSDFNTNRLEIDRDAYMNTRGLTGADLSDRGLSEGFGAGGKFSSMLQRNNASSDIANTYYNSMADIQRQMDIDTQEHNYNVNNLKLNLDSTLADINAREAAARNAYRAQVAQLAEQIQARADARAAANKQYNLALEQAYRDLGSKYNLTGETDVNKVMSTAQALMREAGYSDVGEALRFLQKYGGLNESAVTAATKQSWENFKAKNYLPTTTYNKPTTYNATNRKPSTTTNTKTKYSGTNRSAYYDDRR